MAGSSEHHEAEAKRNPLIPVGVTVLAILVIPLCIYSFGPEGPIKKNHVVFSLSLIHISEPTRPY